MCKELINKIENTIVRAVMTNKTIKTSYGSIIFQVEIQHGKIIGYISKTDLLENDLINIDEKIQEIFGYKSFSHNSSIKNSASKIYQSIIN